MTSFKELFFIKNSQFLCPNTQLMRTYDTREFYITDPAPDRRSVSTASDDEEDFEETSDTDESAWAKGLSRGWKRAMILLDI